MWLKSYYRMEKVPDLTLSKYSSLDEGDVEGVLEQHQAFWRQLNRRGTLLNECFHFICEYDPNRENGKRLELCMCVDSNITEGRLDSDGPQFMEQTLMSSAISPYFTLKPVNDTDAYSTIHRSYAYSAHLVKKERFMTAKDPNITGEFYMVSDWKMNESARLYNMFKLMSAINSPCAYCVTVRAVDYSIQARKDLATILSVLRKATSLRVSKGAGSVGVDEKDQNARDTLDAYEDLIEKIDTTPHFIVDTQVLADDKVLAQYVLDAAAAEALSEGSHTIRCYAEKPALSVDGLPCDFEYCVDSAAPRQLSWMPHLFFLEELGHLAVFPSLYPGEFIDSPKETLPGMPEAGLVLGKDDEGHTIRFELKNLSKHAFLCGVPGSGKTNTMMHLITSMHREHQIPVLILEPAKHEYRVLCADDGMKDLVLFSPSANTQFPLHINPFEFPEGMTIAEHIRNLVEVFNGAFALEPPMPFLLDSSVEAVYRDHGWLPAMINCKALGFTYPSMTELYQKIDEKLEKTDYAPEIKSNLKSVLQVRIGSLITREMGDVFDVSSSTIAPEEWLHRSAIIELESMGKDPANFLSLLLSTLIRESLKVNDYVKPPDGRPRHVMFFEEAHNLIGPTAEQSGDNVDPKTSATAMIVKMLAEVRALGEGIVIADQLPTAMAPEVIKNTSLKIGMRMTAQDDRELLGSTMSADTVQLERMATFEPGEALCTYEKLLKAFKIRVVEYKGKEGNGSTMFTIMTLLTNPLYLHDLDRSRQIHFEKWSEIEKSIKADYKALAKYYKEFITTEDATKQIDLDLLDKIIPIRNKVVERSQSLLLDSVAYYSMMAPVIKAAKQRPTTLSPETTAFFKELNVSLNRGILEKNELFNRFEHVLSKTVLPVTKEELDSLNKKIDAFRPRG